MNTRRDSFENPEDAPFLSYDSQLRVHGLLDITLSQTLTTS
jgi:hypothetical protein